MTPTEIALAIIVCGLVGSMIVERILAARQPKKSEQQAAREKYLQQRALGYPTSKSGRIVDPENREFIEYADKDGKKRFKSTPWTMP